MRRFFLAAIFLICSGTLYADCNNYALHGDWTVFYRNNAFPTSVLAPEEKIIIQYDAKRDQYSVKLTDRVWGSWNGTWSHECIDGQTVLFGAIERRSGGTLLVVEVSRVSDINDLLPRQSGELKLNQIVLHFPDLRASSFPDELRDALMTEGLLASHPGQAHGDND